MTNTNGTTTLQQAVDTYLARQDRTAHPHGKTDNGGRWYPSDAEAQDCCNVRSPSRAHPWSLMTHCRTAEHVAHLFGIDPSELRRAVRAVKPANRKHGVYFKSVAMAEDGRYVSIYDGETEYAIGKTIVQAVRTNHGGGYYVYPTIEAARTVSVPERSVAAALPRVVIEVMAEGQYTSYPCTCEYCTERRSWGESPVHPDKFSFSRITPVAVIAPQVA